MRRNPEEGALPMALPASRTRSLEADMGHLPGNLAGKPDFARSRGHLPGKSPRAGAEGRLGTDLSIGSQWVAGLDLLVCSRLRVRAMAERLGRREDRSWPSRSEAGAARTWFPRRPLKLMEIRGFAGAVLKAGQGLVFPTAPETGASHRPATKRGASHRPANKRGATRTWSPDLRDPCQLADEAQGEEGEHHQN